MSEELYVDENNFILITDCKYEDFVKAEGLELYISKKELVKTVKGFEFNRNADFFKRFFEKFMDGSLILYRGMPGCHFNWPYLERGELKSEGENDIPWFTMGTTKTCWLPFADDYTIARVASCQLMGSFFNEPAIERYIRGNGFMFPVGVVLTVINPRTQGIPICWLNCGEIAVKGPLRLPQFQPFKFQFYADDRGTIDVGTTRGFPQQRPYIKAGAPSTKKDIAAAEKWFEKIFESGWAIK